MLLWHSFFFFLLLLLLSGIASTFAHSVKPDRCEFGRCARNCWRQTVSDSAWPVDVIKLRQNWFRRHKPVITCVCVHRRLKFSCSATLKIDTTSLVRGGWPGVQFGSLMQYITCRLRWHDCFWRSWTHGCCCGGAILLPVSYWLTSLSSNDKNYLR